MGLLKKAVTSQTELAGEGLKGFVARSISSGLYVGYIPGAHGTLGSLWGPLLCFLLPPSWLTGLWLLIPALFFVGVWASAVSERYWGHDPGRIVFDEVVGSLATLAFIPLSVPVIWIGFALFRVLDMLKPPPINSFEKLPHGWGVMGDDLMAGIVSNILLRLIIAYYPGIL
ncbi:MAG: phosphatidylglycerophosphatase A family protein [Candidatus Latescibacterota bacterium]